MCSLPFPLHFLILLPLFRENGRVCCDKTAEDRETAARILKQAIELSKHFMDDSPPSHAITNNTARKTAVLHQTTTAKKALQPAPTLALGLIPRAKKAKNQTSFVSGYIFNRSITTASLNDVKVERRMLNHEVRVVQGRCDINKVCPPDQYCDGIFCFIYKKEGDNCDLNGECERGSECQFGVCSKGVSPGDPGTFCDLARDCSGENQCCIRELSISHHTSICKPLLQMHESCGPINLFHQAEMKAHVEPLCGPCEKGLACKGIGIYGRHSICLPNDEE